MSLPALAIAEDGRDECIGLGWGACAGSGMRPMVRGSAAAFLVVVYIVDDEQRLSRWCVDEVGEVISLATFGRLPPKTEGRAGRRQFELRLAPKRPRLRSCHRQIQLWLPSIIGSKPSCSKRRLNTSEDQAGLGFPASTNSESGIFTTAFVVLVCGIPRASVIGPRRSEEGAVDGCLVGCGRRRWQKVMPRKYGSVGGSHKNN
uniref:Uncharacterized protein n=1 Tax=Mycena chlorophos TaxID=658473 RepID=A0ABQ0LP62_MYCCL|nr:predicted protein [Mycena chlorophos]